MHEIAVNSLVGTWRRSLLAYPDGRFDNATDVTWLQGPSFYGDLRLPCPAPETTAACLRDLNAETIEILARQEGFAGILVQRDDHFEWQRLIDYQPKGDYADRGSLKREGDLLIEIGIEVAYLEHWHLMSGTSTSAKAMLLKHERTHRNALLVQVGERFVFARDRALPLSPGDRLIDQVRKASNLSARQDLVDCEISIGSVDDGWRIVASTLPWRRGAPIAAYRDGDHLILQDVEPDGTPVIRRWEILQEETA